MTEIAGRVAVVTGGGSGIGRGLAKALAAEGATVVIADLNQANAEAAAKEIESAGGTALGLACDVCERDAVREMKQQANAAFGPVSLLFSNAGATSVDRLTDLSDGEYDWLMQLNLLGGTNCLQVFLPDMLGARDGHVTVTASMAGLLPALIPYHAPYAAAKAGLIGLMFNLRTELSEFDIGCTVLCPGGVATGIGNSPSYRTARFGGPIERTTVTPAGFKMNKSFSFRTPEQIAPMVLLAVKRNRMMVLTDASQRADFMRSYVEPVMEAFDDAEAYDQEHPEATPAAG